VTDTLLNHRSWRRLRQLDSEFRSAPWTRQPLLDDALCVVASRAFRLSAPFSWRHSVEASRSSGDIELFARAVDAPVVGITGTKARAGLTRWSGAWPHARNQSACGWKSGRTGTRSADHGAR